MVFCNGLNPSFENGNKAQNGCEYTPNGYNEGVKENVFLLQKNTCLIFGLFFHLIILK